MNDTRPRHHVQHSETLLVLALALAGACIARIIANAALGDVPHVQDEQAYFLQARTFAMGHLFGDVPLPRAAFAMWYVDDRWARFSIFPPGWPALLAVGVKLHLVSWVNPALHAVTTWFVAQAALHVGGKRAQVAAAAMYALSPQAILLGASMMSHALVACCAAVAACAGARMLAATTIARRRDFLFAGAAIGVAVVTRPLCATAIAIGVLAILGHALRHRRASARDVAFVVAPVALGAAALFAYNHALTGSALLFPQTSYFDGHVPPADVPFFRYQPGCNALGFGPGHGCDFGIRDATHDVRNALSNTADNLFAWLLLAGGGPISFAFAACGLALRAELSRATRALVAAPFPAVVVLYALYWYAGTSYGARFYHAALPGVIVLAALGVASLLSRSRASSGPRGRALLLATFAALFVWNAFALARSNEELARRYWSADDRFARVAHGWRGDDALVMLAFAREPSWQTPLFWTSRLVKSSAWMKSQLAGSALAENTPTLDGKIVFAKFHPALVAELRARFPRRRLWLYVEHERAADDVLVPYDPVADRFGADAAAMPKENFDGYEVDDAALR